MLKGFNKKTAFLLSFVLIVVWFTGCGSPAGNNIKGSEIKLNGDKIYPMECEDTLTHWMGLNTVLTSDYKNFGETPLAQELEKRTGVKVEYLHPQAGQEKEQFNIMLAGDDLPDVIQYGWNSYAGGPDKAIQEEYIIPLNSVLSPFAPSFSDYIKKNPQVEKKIKTDSGNFYTFPFIRGEGWLTTYQGLILRKDWLQQINKEVPKTVDQLESILTGFKGVAKGAPLVITPAQRNYFMYAHNIAEGFYLEEGKVKYGPGETAYKEVLIRLKNWYDNGLLDNNLVSVDSKYITSRILNGDSGVFYGAVVGGIGLTMDARPADTSFDLVAASQITLTETDVPEFSTKEDNVNINVGAAISASCKNIELAVRYLDYGYTEEGYNLFNFGIEGESYNMVDGEPVLSELLTKNPDGLTITSIAPRYLRASYSGQFVQDKRYVEQSLVYPKQQRDAYDKWSKTNMSEHLLPPITLKEEELDKDADIMGNLKTYVDEKFVAFVTGKEPIENFEQYLRQLENFGLSKVITMRQEALERYNKR